VPLPSESQGQHHYHRGEHLAETPVDWRRMAWKQSAIYRGLRARQRARRVQPKVTRSESKNDSSGTWEILCPGQRGPGVAYEVKDTGADTPVKQIQAT
jgi:hypothetical protein